MSDTKNERWTTGLYNNFYKDEYQIKREKKGSKKNNFVKVGNEDEEGFTTFKKVNISFNNVCFMNSSIQCFSHLVKFREIILSLEENSNLIKETKHLFREMREGKKKFQCIWNKKGIE